MGGRTVRSRILLAVTLLIGVSHAALAGERTWNWLYIYPPKPNPASKSVWHTDQGIAKDNSQGRSFDIRIGGSATAAEPDHLDLYELKGNIRGNSVTATLIGLDTDEGPEQLSGKLVTKGGASRISLLGTDGNSIFLYRPAKNSNWTLPNCRANGAPVQIRVPKPGNLFCAPRLTDR